MASVESDSTSRYLLIDAFRAVAIVAMVLFHFCYDLSYFGLAEFDFYRDPFWLNARTVILGAFLGLVGVSLWLAHGAGVRLGKASRRVIMIAVNAGLVSLATFALFGERWIFFGVLHFICVASLAGLVLVRSRALALAVGVLCLWGGHYAHPFFDQIGLRWIGFMTHKPATEDYVPLVPWFGVVALGIVVAPFFKTMAGAFHGRTRAWRLFAATGRHSLLIYMLHQPLLIGALKIFVIVRAAYDPVT
jgi:uncharacterized membrane protein